MSIDLSLLKILVDVGSFGLVAWIFVRTFGTTIPEAQKQFLQALAEQRVTYQALLRDSDSRYIQALIEQRQAHHEAMLEQRQSFTNSLLSLQQAWSADLHDLANTQREQMKVIAQMQAIVQGRALVDVAGMISDLKQIENTDLAKRDGPR